MRTITVKAEGLRAGAPTRKCINLISDPHGGDGLVIRPELPPISASGESAGAFRREPSLYPPVRWRVAPAGELWQPIERFVAGDSDSESVASLTQAELRRYSASIAASYATLCTRSEEAGLFMQPVLTRYRLTDASGRTLFVSQPSVVALPDGWQCVAPLEASVTPLSKGIEIGEMLIRAETFSLEAQVPDYSDFPEVSLVQLEISPMLHPVDNSKVAAVAVRKNHSNNPVAVIALPGTTSCLSDLSSWRTTRLADFITRCGNCMRIVRRLPAAVGNVSVIPLTEGASLGWMIVSTPEAESAESGADIVAECGSPHGMVAQTMEHAGDTLVFGGVTPLPWSGPHPGELILPSGSGESIPAVTRVWFGNRMLERSGTIETEVGTQLRITPMIIYPHPAATRIEVIATYSDGRRVGWKGELFPTSDMSAAMRVENGLTPPMLAPLDEEPSDSEEYLPVARENVTLICPAADTAHPVAAATVGSGSITALIAADRSLAAWDSSRAHLYALSTDGLLGLTASASRREISAMMLDPQPVNSVTTCSGRIYAATPRGVMRLSGATLTPHAFTPKNVERIIAHPDSGLVILHLTGGEVRAVDCDGVMAVITEPRTAFEWSTTLAVRPGEYLTEVLIGLRATGMKGVVEICGSGPGGKVKLVSLSIEGNVERPLLIRRVSAPHRARLTLRIAGTATWLRLNSASLTLSS